MLAYLYILPPTHFMFYQMFQSAAAEIRFADVRIDESMFPVLPIDGSTTQ